MKKLFIFIIAFSFIASASLAVVQKASSEAKAKTKIKANVKAKVKPQIKAKQKAKKQSRFTNNKNKVHQDAILQNLKYKMTIKKGKKNLPPPVEEVHPSEQF
jgi:hypothetical protein